MKLYFHEFGTGQPLIILHGLLGLSDNWVAVGKKCAGFFRVLIPDLRNHGRSPHSPVFDFPSLEDDLLEFIETHELERPLILGHSLGGKTAMMFALHQPERVDRLIVADISLRRYPPNTEHQMLIRAMLDADLTIVKSRRDVETQLMRTVGSERLRQFLLKNLYWTNRGNLAWRPDIHAINENLHTILEEVEIPGTYAGPSLFIRGGLSDYVTDDDLGQIRKKFPGAVVKTIAGATHWVHADAPGEFFESILAFLRTDQ